MLSILKCPVCQGRLTRHVAAAAACEQGHSFDIARQGYVNLLLPDKRRSDEPGDSPDMLRSRRAFLQAGFFEPLATAVAGVVADVAGSRAPLAIADLGCGEGYYLARLKPRLDAAAAAPHDYYGVDISRTGVRMATTYDRAMTWIVGTIHNSPFLPASLDVVLSIFAPIAADDLRRIVRDDGAVVTVTPGPDHLDALRALIYPSVEPHAIDALCGDARFTLAATTRVRYPIAIHTREAILHLLAMTPYYWNISVETKSRVETLNDLATTVDAHIRVFRPR